MPPTKPTITALTTKIDQLEDRLKELERNAYPSIRTVIEKVDQLWRAHIHKK